MIDPEEDKKFSIISALEYLENKRFKIEKFLDEKFRKVDHKFILKEMLKNPISFAYIIKYNYELNEQQRIRLVLQKITKEGSLTIMIGAKGYGKTATSIWLLEKIHSLFPNIKLYWFGYNEELEKQYPYVDQTYDLVRVEPRSFLVLDEGSLFLFARESMTKEQREKIKKLPTLRHRGLSLLIISQFSTSLDIDLFLLSDYLWFKPYFVSELDSRLNLPSYLKYCLPSNPNENLVYDLNKEVIYTFTNPLPSRWNDNLSKPSSLIKDEEEANRLIKKLKEKGFNDKEIETILRIRGYEI
jgi:hypothetical protein